MNSTQTDLNSDARIFFFDNLRYLIVLLVVLFHSMCSYSQLSDWWTVDDHNHAMLDPLMLVLDVFMMPALFFIAGYFALLSHKGIGTWQFIKKKLFHLGIPCLIGLFLFNPLQRYIWKVSQKVADVSFLDSTISRTQSALSGFTGLLNLSDRLDQFGHLHFWFISLLLCFFIGFALIRKITTFLPARSGVESGIKNDKKQPKQASMLIPFVLATVFIFFANLMIYGAFPAVTVPNTWVVFGNVVMFQGSRIALQVVCFCLGIMACHKKWFIDLKLPGNVWFWIIATGLLCLLYLGVLRDLMNPDVIASPGKRLFYVILHPLFFFTTLLTLIRVASQYWNSNAAHNRFMAANSYNVYLVHMVFVNLFQLALLNVSTIPVYLKAVLVFVPSAICSILVSHFAINQSKPLSVAGMAGVFIVLLFVL